MTTVTFIRQGEALYGFQASGHAGYDAYGKDILCAAVSALTQSASQGITQVARAKAEVRTDEKEGFLELTLTQDENTERFRYAQVLLKTLENALVAIAKDRQYSGKIRINYRERRQKHV